MNNNGNANNNNPGSNLNGARPSLNLRSIIRISSGTGKKDDPFEIYIDDKEFGPVCVFSAPSNNEVSTVMPITFNLECTDSNGIMDTEVSRDSFTYNSTEITIISVSPTEIDNGYKYTIRIVADPQNTGATTSIIFKEGILSDTYGNYNEAVTSSEVTALPD